MTVAAVGGNSDGQCKRPSARTSTALVEGWVLVVPLVPGYSSGTGKRGLDSNLTEQGVVWAEGMHTTFPVPTVVVASLAVRQASRVRIFVKRRNPWHRDGVRVTSHSTRSRTEGLYCWRKSEASSGMCGELLTRGHL